MSLQVPPSTPAVSPSAKKVGTVVQEAALAVGAGPTLGPTRTKPAATASSGSVETRRLPGSMPSEAISSSRQAHAPGERRCEGAHLGGVGTRARVLDGARDGGIETAARRGEGDESLRESRTRRMADHAARHRPCVADPSDRLRQAQLLL